MYGIFIACIIAIVSILICVVFGYYFKKLLVKLMSKKRGLTCAMDDMCASLSALISILLAVGIFTLLIELLGIL